LLKIKFVLNLHSLNSNGIGPWCNGNTTVFGAVFLGSSPSGPTSIPDQQWSGIIIFRRYVSVSNKKIPNSRFKWSLGFLNFYEGNLDLKSNHRSYRMIYEVFADASVEEMRESGSSVRTHSDQIGRNAIGKVEYAFLDVHIVVNV
jgi:hypothetical protein